jgi:hypothetical protein
MGWFYVDDGFYTHPKVMQVGNSSVGLWLKCGAYSARFGLDGVVIHSVISAMGGRQREVDQLVAAGLWVPNGSGWKMHDYLDYNRSKEELDARKAALRDRQAKWRANHA